MSTYKVHEISWPTSNFGAQGVRDVLIIASDLPLPNNPEAVPRRPAQLTKEDQQKLKSQGVPSDCQDESAIIKARYELNKRFRVKTSETNKPLFWEDVMKDITKLLNHTKNDGGML